MVSQLLAFLKSGLGKKEKLFLSYGVLCVTIFVLYTSSLPYFLKLWVDGVLETKDEHFLVRFGIILSLVTLVAILIDWLGAYLLIKVRETSRAEIRLKLINQLQRMPVSEVEKKESGYFTEVLLSDVDYATGMIVSIVYMVVPAAVSLPASVYWSFKLSSCFAIIGLIGFVLIFANVYLFSSILRRLSADRQDLYSKASGVIQESILGNFFIRLSQMEEQIGKRNWSVLNSLKESSIKKHLVDYSAGTVERFVTQILQVVAVFAGLYLIIAFKSELTAAAVMTGIFYLIKIWSPINMLSSLNADFQGALASSKRISDIIESKAEAQAGEVVLGEGLADIECTGVSIKIGAKKLIENLNLRIQLGSKLGIKGKSGCGKTTLLKTLFGFYQDWTGSIKYNDIELKDVKKTDLLSRIGYMPQDVFVFRENLHFNIALNYSHDSVRMQETIRKFHLERLFGQTGQESLIPANISGGEKKRIGLARLFYADKEAIVLDEPFSGLDGQTRKTIFDEITMLFKDKTVIIVSHDERDLAWCDLKIDL